MIKLHLQILDAISNNDYDTIVYLSQFSKFQKNSGIIEQSIFDNAMQSKNHQIISFLYEKGFFKNISNLKILQTAINKHNSESLDYFLQKGLHHPSKQDKLFDYDEDLFTSATISIDPECIKLLIKYGGNVNHLHDINLSNILYSIHADLLMEILDKDFNYDDEQNKNKKKIENLFVRSVARKKFNISKFLMHKFPILNDVENLLLFKGIKISIEDIEYFTIYKNSLLLKNKIEESLNSEQAAIKIEQPVKKTKI